MRPLLALVISVSLLGGVYVYTKFADSVRVSAVEINIDFSDADWSVEIRKTFTAVPDPIFGSDSLKVLFKGETVYSRSDEVAANETVEIRPLEGVEVGENELFISANRESNGAALAVLQVTIKKNDNPVNETTISGKPGLPTVSGSVVFSAGVDSDQNETAQ